MKPRTALLLLATSGTMTAVAIVRWRGAVVVTAAAETVTRESAAGHAAQVTGDSLAEWIDYLVSNDPFRLANAPAAVRYELTRETIPGRASAAAPPPAPRPVLVLKAIVGGPPWQAVIDGLPGEPSGAIAEEGKRFDKLLVRSVSSDSVVIQGPDTTWVLSFRRGS